MPQRNATFCFAKGAPFTARGLQAPSFLRRASREAPPVGCSVPLVCVCHGSSRDRAAGSWREGQLRLGGRRGRLASHGTASLLPRPPLGARSCGSGCSWGGGGAGQGEAAWGWKPSRQGPGVSGTLPGEAPRRQPLPGGEPLHGETGVKKPPGELGWAGRRPAALGTPLCTPGSHLRPACGQPLEGQRHGAPCVWCFPEVTLSAVSATWIYYYPQFLDEEARF